MISLFEERDTRYQQRFEAQEHSLQSALNAADRAVAKAETATEKRFEGVNEFRSQLADQARTFLPRQEYDARHETLVDQMGAMGSRLTALEGTKSGRSEAIAWASAGFAIFVSVATVVVAIVTR